MCLIVASEEGKVPSKTLVASAWRQNNHGWGIAYIVDGKHIHYEKGEKLEAVQRAVDRAKGRPYVLHFRFATHGKVNVDNTHPFKVSRTLAMAHNGILSCVETPREGDKSDTRVFIEQRLIPWGFVHESAFSDQNIKTMGQYIGYGNKLAFLSSSGRIILINEKQGDWEKGIWYSNLYSHPSRVTYYSCATAGTTVPSQRYQAGNWKRGWDEWDEERYWERHNAAVARRDPLTGSQVYDEAAGKWIPVEVAEGRKVAEVEPVLTISETVRKKGEKIEFQCSCCGLWSQDVWAYPGKEDWSFCEDCWEWLESKGFIDAEQRGSSLLSRFLTAPNGAAATRIMEEAEAAGLEVTSHGLEG